MVVADLSLPNPNVFYELAIRHFTARPIVHLMKSGTQLPFDVNQMRSVPFGLGLREGNAAVQELARKLRAAESDASKPQGNPVTQAKLSGELAKVGTADADVLKLLVEGQNRLVSLVSDLQSMMHRNDRYEIKWTRPIAADDTSILDSIKQEIADEKKLKVFEESSKITPAKRAIVEALLNRMSNKTD